MTSTAPRQVHRSYPSTRTLKRRIVARRESMVTDLSLMHKPSTVETTYSSVSLSQVVVSGSEFALSAQAKQGYHYLRV